MRRTPLLIAAVSLVAAATPAALLAPPSDGPKGDAPEVHHPAKAKAKLGWEPETNFAKGIRLTIEWYLRNMDWMDHVTRGDYQRYYEDMYHI